MDILSVQGLLAMLQIIVIDILLAGDNAIVIGMAARNLPAHLQKKAIFWGTAGAIILRLVMAFLFVEALKTSDKVCFTVYGDERIDKSEPWAPYVDVYKRQIS